MKSSLSIALVCLLALCLTVEAAVLPSGKTSVHFQDANLPKEIDECKACVWLAGTVINKVVDTIAQIGIVGGCAEICSCIDEKLLEAVCNAVCDIAGIEAFAKALKDFNPDPEQVCIDLGVCVEDKAANATLTSTRVTPVNGPPGTTFGNQVRMTVYATIDVGQFAQVVTDDSGKTYDTSYTELNNYTPGDYTFDYAVKTTSTTYSPGFYTITSTVCQSDCSASDAKVLSTIGATFRVDNTN